MKGEWVPGQASPNPAGRPKVAWQVREEAKRHALNCLRRFIRESQNEDPKIALPACKEILRMAGVSFDSETLERVLNEMPAPLPPLPAKALTMELAEDAPPLN